MKLKALLTFGLLVASSQVSAASPEMIALSNAQDRFVQLEWENMNCVYGEYLDAEDAIRSRVVRDNFQPPSPTTCASNAVAYRQFLATSAWQHPAATRAFPNYLSIIHGVTLARARELQGTPFLTAPQSPQARRALRSARIEPWSLEQRLRAELGVESRRPTRTDCPWKQDRTSLSEARTKIYDLNYWKAELFEQGYDCTISRFKAASLAMNAETNRANAQAIFDQERRRVVTTPHDKMNPDSLRGLHIAVFPQLAYDAPKPMEKLTYKKLEKDLKKLGATLDVMERVTSSSVTAQVNDSKSDFEKLLRKYPNSKILVLTRSMGGMVAREMLERFPNLRARVSGVIEMGSTPFGAVIADYKSRGDTFDGIYIERRAFLESAAVAATGWFNRHLRDLHYEAMKRENIASMSFRRFSPAASAQRQLDLPVLNVIQLPDSVGNYFGFQEAAPVDPAFLLMSMYGPTEGSAAITHTAWDTKNSARVFVGQFNHLGFWGLDPDLAVDYTVAAIRTAKHLGVW